MTDIATIELTAGNVKAAMSDAGAKSSDLWMVPRNSIKTIPGFNDARAMDPGYPDHIKNIGSLIHANGYDKSKPCTVFIATEDGAEVIYVTDGYTRLLGVDYANSLGSNIEVIPCVQKPKGTSMEDLTIDLFTSSSGRAMTTLGKALNCKRLIGYGMEEAEIAQRLNYTVPYVQDLLLLMGANRKLHKMVSADEVSASTAIEALKKHGAKAVDVLGDKLTEVKASGKSKVTKGTLTPKAPKRDLAAEGVQFIRDGGYTDPAPLVALLAHILGEDVAKTRERLNAAA